MRGSTPALLVSLAVAAIGCGDQESGRGQDRTSREEAGARGTTVTRAIAKLSIRTHSGTDTISGLRISGRCRGDTVALSVGYGPPYVPLRERGVPRVDRTRPPRRHPLRGACRDSRFDIRVEETVSVPLGRGPLMVEGETLDARSRREVQIQSQALE